jgi:hypothetical protein
MTLAYYQFSYNGFVFGSGTPYVVNSVDGLANLPELRAQDVDRGYNDGMFTGRDFLNGRTITVTLNVLAGNGNSASQNWALFQNALTPVQQLTSSNGLLQFQLAATDTPKRMTARVRTRVANIDPEYTYGYITAQVTFFSPDPRYYDESVTTTTLTPTRAFGRTYNRGYNLVYTQALTGAAGSTATVVNGGSGPMPLTITITGPMSSPQITNLTTGQYLQLTYNLSSTDTVTLDMTNNIVLLNGGTARNLLTGGSQWFTIPANTTQTLFLSAVTATGQASITYRNAWI